jgi:hypothetical protein
MKKYLKSHFPKLSANLAAIHQGIMKFMPMEYVFTKTYQQGGWGCSESVSGRGSSLEETAEIRKKLPGLFKEFNIKTLLDVPCGDFNWMKEVAPSLERYIGGDIVKGLVNEDTRRYAGSTVSFMHLDAMKDRLPQVDCILCRDMLVHFPFRDIIQTIRNFKASGAQYLLVTTFPATEMNRDIEVADWRMINLEKPPFNFPPAVGMIVEQCLTKPDKSLALYRLSDLHIVAQ